MNYSVTKTLPKIEISETPPTALVISNETTIYPFLVEQLLNLSLKVIVYQTGEADEVKHLIPNEHFRLIKQESLLNFPEVEAIPISYIFEIRQEKEDKTSHARDLQQEEVLFRLISEKQAKYELILITNQERISNYTNETSRTLSSFEKSLQPVILENARIILVVDVYGPRISFNGIGELANFFQNIQQREIEVVGEGLIPFYPLYITDAISAFIKGMFSEGAKGKTLIIGGEQEITALNLAYKLREIYLRQTRELIEIKFIKGTYLRQTNKILMERHWLKQEIYQAQKILDWKPTTELEDGLANTLQALPMSLKIIPEKPLDNFQTISTQPVAEKTTQQLHPEPRAKLILRTIQKTRWQAAVIILIFMILAPPLVLAGTFGAGVLAANLTIRDIKQANFTNSQKMAETAIHQFSIAKQQFLLITSLFPNSLQKTVYIESLENMLSASTCFAQALLHSSRIGEHTTHTKDIILGKANASLEEEAANINFELNELFINLSMFETMLDAGEGKQPKIQLESIRKKIAEATSEVQLKKSLILDVKNLFNLLVNLLEQDQKQAYLVLLQNNAELRPTGGFIGSYALLSFDRGRLVDFTVEDVYVADGQLKGHVEPPPPIKKYLGEAGWYLRDANWDADFPTTARQIEWFFEKETGNEVDGTIAINLYVVQALLRAVGPIQLKDYQDTITSENLFRIAESYSELNSFPGTTQKTDFLGSLAKSLFVKLEEASPKTLIEVVSALRTSLDQGQLLITSHNTEAQQTLNDLGWDGSLREVNCGEASENLPCLKHFFAIREANVGVNKANYYVKRAIALSQQLQPTITQTTLTIRYQNQSPAETWPGGTYKNYLRVYFEKDGELVSVKVDGQELKPSDIELEAEHNKMVIGFLVALPIQQEKTIDITINSQPLPVQTGTAKSVLVFQKQPGTQDDPLTIQLLPQTGIKIQGSSLPLTIDHQGATLSQNFSSDVHLAVEFRKAQ